MRASLANLVGELQQGLGRTEAAISAFRMAADLAPAGKPRLRALLGLGHGLSVLDRFEDAMAVLDVAQHESEELGLPVEQSRIHTLRGNAHFPRGEFARCLAEHTEALRLAEASGAMEEQARALGGLADANYMQRRYRSACEMFQRCVDVSAAQGFRRIEAANLPMLSLMKLMELEFAAADRHIKRAVQIADQIGSRRAAMMAYLEFYGLYYETDRPNLAFEACAESLAIARSLGARRFVAFGLMVQAQKEAAAGDPRASATMREASEITRETPAFVLPWLLGLAAIMARSDEERAAALAEARRCSPPAH